jgi:uncharacterized protein affecting Mg2+/Co2+ transport
MTTALTSGVKISVETLYRKDLSNVENGLFFFNYRIVIENKNAFDVQLKSRFWHIFDSLNPAREVMGEGVVGEQPILASGQNTFTFQAVIYILKLAICRGIMSLKEQIPNNYFGLKSHVLSYLLN